MSRRKICAKQQIQSGKRVVHIMQATRLPCRQDDEPQTVQIRSPSALLKNQIMKWDSMICSNSYTSTRSVKFCSRESDSQDSRAILHAFVHCCTYIAQSITLLIVSHAIRLQRAAFPFDVGHFPKNSYKKQKSRRKLRAIKQRKTCSIPVLQQQQ